MMHYTFVLLVLCIIGITIVNSAYVDKSSGADGVLQSSSKLTDKVDTNAIITEKVNAKVNGKVAKKTHVAATDINDNGWAAVHISHRSLSSATRTSRMHQLRAHQKSLVHDTKVKAAAATPTPTGDIATGRSSTKAHSKVHATGESMRRSRHHAARTRTLAKLTSKASSSGVTEEVLLTNLYDIEYLATVSLGTPAQQFSVILDTGSTDLWFPSSDCTSKGCQGVSTFVWSQSSTFVDLNVNLTETFGSGTLEGYLATDTFGIGNLSVPAQTVALIETEDLDTDEFDGLMGLAFSALSDTGASPVFDHMMELGLLAENKFSLFLSRDVSVDSAVIFGTPRQSLYTGDITYIEVSKQLYWQVTMVDIKVNGVLLNVCPDGCQAVIDSGTSLLTASYAGVLPLLNAINALSDCSNLSELPPIIYIMKDQYGTYEIPLDASNYMLAESIGNEIECVPGYMSYDLTDPSGQPIWILGDLFFHQYYMIFDRSSSTPRMGFATANI